MQLIYLYSIHYGQIGFLAHSPPESNFMYWFALFLGEKLSVLEQ